MAEYKLEITTGDLQYAGSSDYIYVTLFGTEGQSERTLMDNYGFDFQTGAVSETQLNICTCLYITDCIIK